MEKKSKKTEAKTQKVEKENIVRTSGSEETICTRGRVFEGRVIKKFPKRVVIAFERMIYVKKYERYSKSRTKIHARLPEKLENEINLGDLISVQECRPLSKIIHFMVIKKIKGAEEASVLKEEAK